MAAVVAAGKRRKRRIEIVAGLLAACGGEHDVIVTESDSRGQMFRSQSGLLRA